MSTELEQRIAELESELSDKENEIEKLNDDLNDANNEISSLKDEINDLEKEKDQLQDELDEQPDLTSVDLGLDTIHYYLEKGNLNIQQQINSAFNLIQPNAILH